MHVSLGGLVYATHSVHPVFAALVANYIDLWLHYCCIIIVYSFVGMEKEDALTVFQDHIRELEKEEEHDKERERRRRKQQERKNRDNFGVCILNGSVLQLFIDILYFRCSWKNFINKEN
jgi:hypothetical protein